MEVIWSAKAKITYFNVLDYLDKNWTKKKIRQNPDSLRLH